MIQSKPLSIFCPALENRPDHKKAFASLVRRAAAIPMLGALACTGVLFAPAVHADTMSTAFDMHKRGQYEAAAVRGLDDLLSQPWNHKLRFVVADSLQRTGRIDEAVVQLEALDGTPFGESARIRLQTIRSPGPARPAYPAQQQLAAAAGPDANLVLRSAYQPTNQDAGATAVRPAAGSAAGAIVQSQYMPQPTRAQPASQQTAQPQFIAPSGQAVPIDSRATPPAVQRVASQVAQPEGLIRSAAAAKVADLYAAEKYYEAGSLGSALMQWEKVDDELALAIANSLAWTGRLTEAINVYQRLTSGRLRNDAQVGIASAQRWRGRDDLALPLYRDVLAADPLNQAAKEGLVLAQREMRPRTTLTIGGSEDSSDVRRDAVTLNHRWRDSGGINIIEVETSRIAERLGSSAEADQKDLTLRYHATTLALKPSFEISLAKNGDQNLYGSVQWKVGDRDDVLQVGRVNWGKLANNPNALEAGLAATHFGAQLSTALELGTLTGRVDYYDISDDNTILNGNVRLLANWRPLGSRVKPFAGIEFRDAKFNTPNYWSPEEGFGSLYAGLLAEWSALDWSFYASGQLGSRLYGDAGSSWSAAAGGKRWLSSDIGVGFGLWSMASQRNNAAYRASSLHVNLEKLW